MAGLRHKPRALALAAFLVIATLAPIPALGDYSDASWRYFKSIELPAGLQRDALVEVLADTEVLTRGAPGLGDLRVIEAGSEREVGYKLLVERGEQRRSALRVSVLDLSRRPGQYTSFVADLGREGLLHNEVEIITPTQNFQQEVFIEAGNDARTWATVLERGRIFDFTVPEQRISQRSTRVQYPSSTARYLRVRVMERDKPVEVAGAVAYFSQEIPPREMEYPAGVTRRTEDRTARTSALVIDLEASGLPSSRLDVSTTQANFHRRVSLESSADGVVWSQLRSSDVLYRYDTPRFTGSKLSVSYPEINDRRLRLTIFNEDDAPLPIESTRVFGFQRKVIFMVGQAGAAYQLHYGNEKARTPAYELEHILPYLVTEDLPRAVLGPHTLSPRFRPEEPPPQPFTERYPWLLPLVVGVAALLIGLFLASLLRQVRRFLPPPA